MEALHHHICPRNCYDTCSIISTTRHGNLVSIEGNPSHEYTKGKLCAKAMEDINRVYSPQRIKYPMRQRSRYSGQWERISWEEALQVISEKILSIKQKYGTTLPIAHNKYSGNFGILHNALEAFMTGLGPTTRAVGSPCWSAGVEAQTFDFGTFFCSDPLDMEKSKLIWVWGANPAWNAVHQMPILFRAMDRGVKVVCLDTHFSATAARSHEYIQVNPGTDGMLALGLAKVLLEHKLVDPELEQYTLGHEEFIDYLKQEISLDQCSEITGVPLNTILELALEYGQSESACIWAGFGLQRYANGGQTLRAIDALAALAGHIGRPGGGVQYGHFETWRFSGPLSKRFHEHDRNLNINRFPREALDVQPPVKMLWMAGRNPLQQDGDLKEWIRLIDQLDLIVVSDLFHTRSSAAADIFLPVTTHYEHWDINAGYWHYYIGVNEPAIAPIGEARSDLQIAWDLSKRLNQLSPGCCSFPIEGSEKESVLKEIGSELLSILEVNTPEELLGGPLRVNFPATAWKERKFQTPSGKYEFYSEVARTKGFPALPIYQSPCTPPIETPLRLLTPHHSTGINSQAYASEGNSVVKAHLSAETASNYSFKNGENAILWNHNGSLPVTLEIESGIPPGLIISYQENKSPLKSPHLNLLNPGALTDMGLYATGSRGMALNETFVSLKKAVT